jgi:hypothetical protein
MVHLELTIYKLFSDVIIQYSLGYLTANLLTGTGLRNTTVGNLATSISNSTNVVVKSMIAGMQMSNSVGVNNYIDVTTTYANGSNVLDHLVIV